MSWRNRKSTETTNLARRSAEQVGMASLMLATRVALTRRRVRDVVASADQISRVLCWAAPLNEHADTQARAPVIAHRWSSLIPGCTCLHRAVSTQLWLAAFGVESRVVMGLRKRSQVEGHAWLELNDGTLFVDDEDGYPVLI